MKFGKQFWVNTLGKKWALNLKEILTTPYANKLMGFLQIEYAMNTITPAKADIFRAFKLCPWDSVKVVILDQRPHTYMCGANGLAYGDRFTSQFSSPELCKIMDCIEREYYNGLNLNFDFELEDWAKQGVLLLNRQLTIRDPESGEHKKPWGKFISTVLNVLNESKPGTIFVLWGKENQKLAPFLKKNNHILTYEHPSELVPLTKDWHCPNFKQVNEILKGMGKKEINW